MSEVIIGRNAVLEALKSGREIEKITLAKGAEGSVKQIAARAREKRIPIYYSEKKRMDKTASGGAHQGVIAVVSDHRYCTVDDILDRARERGEDPFIVVLDGLEDPHNLGAIMRTAECAGVHGIVIPKRRSVSVTETVAKTSAGASEYMLCARVTNIAAELEKLKERGIWTAACDMGVDMYYDRDFDRAAGCSHRWRGYGYKQAGEGKVRLYGFHTDEGPHKLSERIQRGSGADIRSCETEEYI